MVSVFIYWFPSHYDVDTTATRPVILYNLCAECEPPPATARRHRTLNRGEADEVTLARPSLCSFWMRTLVGQVLPIFFSILLWVLFPSGHFFFRSSIHELSINDGRKWYCKIFDGFLPSPRSIETDEKSPTRVHRSRIDHRSAFLSPLFVFPIFTDTSILFDSGQYSRGFPFGQGCFRTSFWE